MSGEDSGAEGPPDAMARDVWRRIAASKMVRFGWTRMASAATAREGGRLTRQWRELLDPIFGDRTFAADGTQAMVATNLTKGLPMVIDRGTLVEGILASAAFPVVASAVEHNGDVLVDGSFTAPVPVLQALDLGAAAVVALVPGRPGSLKSAPAPDAVVRRGAGVGAAPDGGHVVARPRRRGCDHPGGGAQPRQPDGAALVRGGADHRVGPPRAVDQLAALDRRWARNP